MLYHGDCLEIMPDLPRVDAIITDIPYGTTACAWDEVIPFEPMWKEVKRVTGVFITTASQPFTSALVMSNLKWFKKEWVWNKVNKKTNFVHVKTSPLTVHENILVFSNGTNNYHPIMDVGLPYKLTGGYKAKIYHGNDKKKSGNNTGTRYPISIISIKGDDKTCGFFHPTQKPVKLYEYLIRTYTNEGDTVLDIAMGSGTTGVACVQTGRKFIGIEIDEGYYQIAKDRIAEAQLQMRLPI